MSIELNGNKFTTWGDVEKELFTPEEIAENKLKIALLKLIMHNAELRIKTASYCGTDIETDKNKGAGRK